MSRALRRAVPADAALLAHHRALVWIEVGDFPADVMTAQEAHWEAYLRSALSDQRYVAWIAEDDGVPLGSGAVLIGRAIPRPGHPSDLTGRVHSVYVLPVARRSGVARAIMDEILAYARAYELISLTLHPSDEARPLYAALGFEAADEMILRIAGERAADGSAPDTKAASLVGGESGPDGPTHDAPARKRDHRP